MVSFTTVVDGISSRSVGMDFVYLVDIVARRMSCRGLTGLKVCSRASVYLRFALTRCTDAFS